jgi:carbonic anhydrase
VSAELNDLIAGYERFLKLHRAGKQYVYSNLALGQKPKALVIACSDSRVDPGLFLETNPGDLFVVRNVANLVPLFESNRSFHGTSAALEFGICSLGIRHIIVLGHTLCGGITSLFEPPTNAESSFIKKWMELADHAYIHTCQKHKNETKAEQIDLCARYSLINSVRNLCTFPWIAERLKNQRLFLHAWYFNLASGTIFSFEEQSHSFKKLKAPIKALSYELASKEQLNDVVPNLGKERSI